MLLSRLYPLGSKEYQGRSPWLVSLAGDINHDFFADQKKVSCWACRRGEPRLTFSLPHRLILRMGVIAFAGVDFVASLLGNDLDFSEFSIPVLVLWVVPEAVLVMEFV